jgi:phosphoserine phosphatase
MTTSLIAQYRRLDPAAMATLSRDLGAKPVMLGASLARWDQVTVDREQCRRWSDRLGLEVNLVPQSLQWQDFKLIAFDMDSTLITIECLDEMAALAGKGTEVARITEAAMRGEISNYDESLRRRVAMLAGVPVDVMQQVYDTRLQLTPGADTLVARAKRAGLKVMLVSGGFTFFTDRLRDRLGLDFTRANQIDIDAGGRIVGTVSGTIVNAEIKRATLLQACESLGCSPAQAIAVGDGANDLLMLGAAGLSVAHRAKPIVRMQTTNEIQHSGLDAIVSWFGD